MATIRDDTAVSSGQQARCRPPVPEERALPGFLSDRPVWLAFTVLFLVATLRGQATYWLARLVTEQADRRIGRVDANAQAEAGRRGGIGGRLVAVRRWLEGESVARGRRAIRRWGLPAVPLCYLTVGFQTLVLAAAGVLRVHWIAFSLAQLPGALAWAAIYTTIGWAAWEALLHLR